MIGRDSGKFGRGTFPAEIPIQTSETGTNDLVVYKIDWNVGVTHSFEQCKPLDPALRLPWEQNMMQGIFNEGSALRLPRAHRVAIERELTQLTQDSKAVFDTVSGQIEECCDAVFACCE